MYLRFLTIISYYITSCCDPSCGTYAATDRMCMPHVDTDWSMSYGCPAAGRTARQFTKATPRPGATGTMSSCTVIGKGSEEEEEPTVVVAASSG